jgi:NDP-sugar pyrophosphorylase family protein
MQAILLAGGRGKRLGKFTETVPKPMVSVGNHPIIWHTFSSLPKDVDEILIVVGYLGEKVEEYFGDNFNGTPIKYVWQKERTGTAGALWSVRPLIKAEHFLVINGDDIYKKEDLEKFVDQKLSVGLFKNHPTRHGASVSVEGGLVKDISFPNEEESKINDANTVVGIYSLDQRIFEYEMINIGGEEFGLPQTILQMAKDHPIEAIFIDFWQPINSPEELEVARKVIGHERRSV